MTPTSKGGHTDEEVLKASRAAVLVPWLDAVIDSCTKNVPVQPKDDLTTELAGNNLRLSFVCDKKQCGCNWLQSCASKV